MVVMVVSHGSHGCCCHFQIQIQAPFKKYKKVFIIISKQKEKHFVVTCTWIESEEADHTTLAAQLRIIRGVADGVIVSCN